MIKDPEDVRVLLEALGLPPLKDAIALIVQAHPEVVDNHTSHRLQLVPSEHPNHLEFQCSCGLAFTVWS